MSPEVTAESETPLPPRSTAAAWLLRSAEVSALLALGLFVAGGVSLGFVEARPRIAFGRYGLLLLPIVALALIRPGLARTSWLRRPLCWGVRWLNASSRASATLFVVGTLGLVAGSHLVAVFSRYFAFRATMDLAIYANACRGGLYSTMKGDVWLLADHFEPALLLLTPLCRVFHPSQALLAVQVIAFLAGAFGVFRLARDHGWSRATAWFCAFLYLQTPGLVGTVLYDFHLLSLGIGALPWLWLWGRRGHWPAFWLCAMTVLGLKESTALSLAAFGTYLALSPDRTGGSVWARRITGAVLAVISTALFLFIMKWVYPHYRQGEETMYFAKYYGHLGGSMSEFLHTIFARPFYFLSTLVAPRKLLYLGIILAPFAFLPALRPRLLLPALPAIFINVASQDEHLFSGDYHYEAEILPMLFCATIGVASSPEVRQRLQRWRIPWSPRVIWLTVLTVFFGGHGLGFQAKLNQPEAIHAYLDERLKTLVPRDGRIAANQKVATHLTDRPRLYMMDYWGMEEDWRRADLIVIAYPEDDLGWYRAGVMEREKIPKFQSEFDLVYRDPVYPHFRLWKRRGGTSAKGDLATTPSERLGAPLPWASPERAD